MRFMRESTRKKRDTVVDAALKLFIDKGYENVTVDEIISVTNTSKGTFYHYFKSKEDILLEIGARQRETIGDWLKRTPTQVQSLEGHINRLFLDLAANIRNMPRLIRSLNALSLQNESLFARQQEEIRYLGESIVRWLPQKDKAEALLAVYLGTVSAWCYSGGDLEAKLRSALTEAWNGIRNTEAPVPLQLDPSPEEPRLRVAVIGGGLAGLTAAAYLSEARSIEGVLFERSPQLGGRAFTYEKSGFTLNYGAHAIYGIDRHNITKLERELGLSFSSRQVDKRKVMYAKNEQLTPAPLDFVNIMKTGLLTAMEKVRFVGEAAAIIAQIHHIKKFDTLGDYLEQSDASEDLKELWEHLVCSNFFITPDDARKVRGSVISEYYHNLFRSGRPVNYVLGSWAVITNQLRGKIESSGRWELALQEAAESIRCVDGKYVLKTKNRELAFDRVIFAMPVQQVVKLLRGTEWEPFLAGYEGSRPTEVMVYDIGLSRVVARPFSYISDMDSKMFITDVSATDSTLVPEGGQLLQGVAYLSDEFDNEADRRAYLDDKTAAMERLFDRHYPGWRETVAVKRVSKKAMVASVKNVSDNSLLPNRVEHVPFYFCGDGCVGKGELAERSFSSARSVARMILAEAPEAGAADRVGPEA